MLLLYHVDVVVVTVDVVLDEVVALVYDVVSVVAILSEVATLVTVVDEFEDGFDVVPIYVILAEAGPKAKVNESLRARHVAQGRPGFPGPRLISRLLDVLVTFVHAAVLVANVVPIVDAVTLLVVYLLFYLFVAVS